MKTRRSIVYLGVAALGLFVIFLRIENAEFERDTAPRISSKDAAELKAVATYVPTVDSTSSAAGAAKEELTSVFRKARKADRSQNEKLTQQNPSPNSKQAKALLGAFLTKAHGGDDKAMAAAAKRAMDAPPKADALSAAVLCFNIVNNCNSQGVLGTDLEAHTEGCFQSARTCKTDTPWLNEEKSCCHRSCFARYQAARRAGVARVDAIVGTIIGQAGNGNKRTACMPGLEQF